MSTAPNYSITNNSVTIVMDGQTYTTKRGDPNFDAAKEAVIAQNWTAVPPLFSKGLAIAAWANGLFSLQHNRVYYDGDPLPTELSDRMTRMAAEGLNPQVLAKFWERLQLNPSFRSVNQLWDFLRYSNIPLDQDGFIIGYKSIRPDFTDHHTGTVDNHPGQKPRMKRNKVSDESANACDHGFHVGTFSYASAFGGADRIIVLVRVDPADVVRVPPGANKMGTCAYEVWKTHNDGPLPDLYYPSKAPSLKAAPVLARPEPDEDPDDGYDEDYDDGGTDEGADVADGTEAQLLTWKLDDLRAHAKSLGIKNVKAVPGGKVGLIARILEVEDGQTDPDTEDAPDEAIPVETVQPAPSNESPRDLLLKRTLDDLRAYAKTLGVRNVKAIAGGKVGLVDTLLLKPESVAKVPEPVKAAPSAGTTPGGPSREALMHTDLGELRSYASNTLKITGASKIPGGKTALVDRICQVRGF